VAASLVSREGALLALMNLAKALMSSSGSSPQFTAGLLVHGWLSDTSSQSTPVVPTPVLGIVSAVLNRLVIPCSLRYASLENDSRLGIWFFQPNRPPRMWPGASSTGTWMN